MSNRVSHSLVSALRRVPVLDGLDEGALLELVGCSANLTWRSGERIFERGGPAEALYVIISGGVRILEGEGDDSGEEVATIGPGDYFGELSLLLDTNHSKNAVATRDTELMVVPRESFRRWLRGRPGLEELFRRRLEERVGPIQVPR